MNLTRASISSARRIAAAWRLFLLVLSMAVPGLSYAAVPFSFDVVTARARQLANADYVAPTPIPDSMRTLTYDEFQRIRSDPARTLWRDERARFDVMPMIAGLFFNHAVKLNIVTAGRARPVRFSRGYFRIDTPELARKIPDDAGFAGFKLTYPINRPQVRDQFMVFAGASYFRGVGEGDAFGISARGLALDTGQASGEEFPSFVEYWLVKPARNADRMVVYALLDSKRITGAYAFTVFPGKPTRVDVRSVLYPRGKIDLLGVAPLTSMFFYGENTPRPLGEWRPEVHDSDGLLIQNGTGEWLWNPLHNPSQLHTQAFLVNDVRGFGLLQRDRRFDNYQDVEAQYQRRPSTWVQPRSRWGAGRIVLVKIPSGNETNDNMVAFWSPPAAVDAARPLRFDYRVLFGDSGIAGGSEVGRAIETFVGRGDIVGGGNAPGAYRVVVDFRGGRLEKLARGTLVSVDASVQEGGELIEREVRYIAESDVWRVALLARPAEGRPLALRAALRDAQGGLTETWTYTLPAVNAMAGEKK